MVCSISHDLGVLNMLITSGVSVPYHMTGVKLWFFVAAGLRTYNCEVSVAMLWCTWTVTVSLSSAVWAAS